VVFFLKLQPVLVAQTGRGKKKKKKGGGMGTTGEVKKTNGGAEKGPPGGKRGKKSGRPRKKGKQGFGGEQTAPGPLIAKKTPKNPPKPDGPPVQRRVRTHFSPGGVREVAVNIRGREKSPDEGVTNRGGRQTSNETRGATWARRVPTTGRWKKRDPNHSRTVRGGGGKQKRGGN